MKKPPLKGIREVKGPVIQEGDTEHNYTFTVTQPLPNDITAEEVTKLTNEKKRFRWIIANKDQNPIHIVNDIFLYVDYDPDNSRERNT
ncbi:MULTISPECIES: hypothetical protein [Pontibacillus]|uniref:Uncharacterized protein n=1 Tax=Pontibacillus chungwhensis TaxID=265426 RepID=A0ABY8UST6_9BACI|nr:MULTISPECIES: hypothetical protein [Pontibacillus]WIF96735.1 hypothetical protein QNI29_13355 [Pontibacillus chungwhensis]